MADFASRPEVTVSTMGRVHNPSGQGVRATSSQVQAKKMKKLAADQEESSRESSGTSITTTTASSHNSNSHKPTEHVDTHETKVKEGTAYRNITRKRTDSNASGQNYDSRMKKQGGHGKGEWKEILDPIDPDYRPIITPDDPLYDEEQQGAFILSSSSTTKAVDETQRVGYDESHTGKAIYGPLLTLSEFKLQVAEAIKEYFDSGDSDEVIRTVLELQCQEFHCEMIKKMISLAMDKGPREREMTSRLLTSLHPTPLADHDMESGFTTLLNSLEDLQTDVPDAITMVSAFLARAVVDEVLPPAFLSDQNNERPGDPVIEKAVSLLSREHCNARLEKVWGPGDGRPVAELKTEMDQLLQEYLLSRELDEAARCVKELEAPHFHHELVKRGVKIAMELDGSHANGSNGTSSSNGGIPHELSNLDAMAALFGFLVRNVIISEYQVKKGIARLHTLLSDLSLDVPAAPKLLTEFEAMAAKGGCLGSTAVTAPETNGTTSH